MKQHISRLLLMLMLFMGMNSSYAELAGLAYPEHDMTEAMMAPPPPPPPGFTYTPSSGCAPLLVQFSSQAPGTSPSWNFGDPSSGALNFSTDCNPVHVFNLPGSYTVTLTTSSGTYSQTVTVGAVPVVTITGNNFVCLNSSWPYLATPIAGATYSWAPMGGTVTSGQGTSSVSITWNTYGVNLIRVTVTTGNGCVKIFEYEVKVVPPPQVDLPCQKRGSENGKDVDYCAGSIACYSASILPGFGSVSDYTWNWTATNGTVIPGAAPNEVCVQWGTVGTGNITLTVTHATLGCVTVVSCDVNIKPGITPNFNAGNGCKNNPILFDASLSTPLSDIATFEWDFGNGDKETTTLPYTNYTYQFTGTYNVSVTITTKAGCVYKLTDVVIINTGTYPPIECVGTVCQGSKHCYSTPLVSGATYTWSATGAVSVVPNGNQVCVTWGPGPLGSLTVNVATSYYTCSNTNTVSVPIIPTTVPITAPVSICQGSTFAQASAPVFPGACYKWTVLSGGSVSGSNTESTVYISTPSTSNADIVIQVEVDFGLACCKGIGTATIKKRPSYSITGQTYVCENSTHTYSLSYPGPVPNVTWSISGGTPAAATGTSVNVTWGNPGNGIITVTNNSQSDYCNTSNQYYVTIMPVATGDDIQGPAIVCAGSTQYAYFHAPALPSYTTSVTAPGAIISAGTNQSNISFPSPGTYTITVVYNYPGSNPSNCSTTKTFTVVAVPSTLPTISGPTFACSGETKTYVASAGFNPAYHEWEVLGGTITSGAGTSTITVAWNSTVTSTVSIKNKVCGNSTTYNVTVNGLPINFIKVGGLQCDGSSVTLTASPTWTYLWSTAQTSQTITITSPGTYSVWVSNGVCSTQTTISFTSLPRHTRPTINSVSVSRLSQPFCPPKVTICPNITTGSGAISSYNWTFTNATPTSSSMQCPVVQITGIGGTANYNLIVTDANGCKDTLAGNFSDTCRSTPPGPCAPTPTFTTTYDPCTQTFTSSSTNALEYFWEFGDGTIGGGLNPVHPYTTPCNKTVRVYVKNTSGCWYSFNFNIAVPYILNPTSVANIGNPCTGTTSLGINGLIASCTGSGISASYSWTFTGPTSGTYSGAPPFSLSGFADGNYTVSCLITMGSCTRIVNGAFTKGGLKALFAACGGCANSAIQFTDLSTQASAPIIKWQWTFGPPGATSFLQNPQYTYTSTGTWPVSLTVTDDNGCTNTYNGSVVINPALSPAPIVVKKGTTVQSGTVFTICKDEGYNLTAPAGYSYQWSTGEATQVINVTQPGDYYVMVYNTMGCAAKVGTIHFNFKPQPKAIIQGALTGCSPLELSGFPGMGYTYAWTYPVSLTSSLNVIYANNSGTVQLTVTNPYGCSNTTTAVITVQPSPTINLSSSSGSFSICEGETITVTASSSAASPSYVWYNGSGGTSVAISQPGDYWVTVTDLANGCPTKSKFTVYRKYTPNISQIPYGCYQACGHVSFCAGIVPSGYTGQWTESGNPYGPSIPAGGSIGLTVSTSGTFQFKLTPISPSFGCPITSDPLIIQIIQPPSFTITTNTPMPILCKNSGQSITLTVTPADPSLTYIWSGPGGFTGIGTSVVVNQPGVYTVSISTLCGCDAHAQIIIEEMDCCFENPYITFTPIPDNTVINTNTFWDGKYYIAGKVYIMPGVTLDITNVDCAFDTLGELIFLDRSVIRANNSVFRPCDKDKTWIGCTFQNRATGWINTSTLKNALHAVYLDGNRGGVRLTDNTFIKCNVSVLVNKSSVQQSISGNTFEIDDTRLYGGFSSDYTGIRLISSSIEDLISQNNFRHVKPVRGNNRYFGISSISSYFTASENNFLDMFRAVDVSNSPDVVALEKNTFKVNSSKEDWDKFQVRVTDNTMPLLVYANAFDNGQGASSGLGGLYIGHCEDVHIKDNTFNGFHTSISCADTRILHINSNHVTNGVYIGIRLSRCFETRVSCNDVRMWERIWDNTFPTALLTQDCDDKTEVVTNCFFNSSMAVRMEDNTGAQMPHPIFVNNFLYNYVNAGLFLLNHSGNVGTSSAFNNAGRNTFMSNNFNNGATDIYSSAVGIFEGGNFGVLNTFNVTSTSGMDELNSTADCGVHIGPMYMNNQQDGYNTCDVYRPYDPSSDGKGKLVSKEQGVNKLGKLTTAVTAANIKAAQKDAGLEAWLQSALLYADDATRESYLSVIATSELSAEQKLRVKMNYYMATRNAEEARTSLSAFAPVNPSESALKTCMEGTVELMEKGTLSDNTRAGLTAIDDARGAYAAIARDVLHMSETYHPYIFTAPEIKQVQLSEATMKRIQNSLQVFPVPSNDKVTLQFAQRRVNENQLIVIDPLGRRVDNFSTSISAGKIEIDISKMAAGIYHVTILSDDKATAPLQGTFVKM